jgi:hypothetical protein
MCLAVLVWSTATGVSAADDVGAVTSELGSAPDFRVRVGAALALGKAHDERSVNALARALDDRHPAVRAAAAAAIGATGDRAALPALRRRQVRERASMVRAQIASTIAALEPAAPAAAPGAARVLVKLGQMQNLAGARGAQLRDVFRGATRARASALPGVEVLGDASEALGEGALRQLPVLLLDGVVIRLRRGSEAGRVIVSAEVEYVFRKTPEHALKASFAGSAKALGGAQAPTDGARVALLEEQALRGAVESAMRGAPEVMLQALRSDDPP